MTRAGSSLLAGFAAACLSACGGPSAAPTVSFPMEAPEGAPEQVSDFLAICSRAMIRDTGALAQLAARGWGSDESEIMKMAAAGATGGGSKNGNMMMIMPVDLPHTTGVNCFLSGQPSDDASAADLLKAIDELDGFYGEIRTVDGVQNGAWSAIGPDGHVVVLHATNHDEKFISLNMNTGRQIPMKPQK